jgi:NAD(P)-dependent dehydrogenase (short-subunit alcohol dehydrogenase family)
MSQQMQGKVCLITGGAGSIGAATALLLADEGAKVMLVDLHEATLKSAAIHISKNLRGPSSSNESLAWSVADVTKSEQVKSCVAATVSRWGKIDVLFSNAGNFGVVAPVAEYPEEVFDGVLAVHVKGAFLAAKHTLPHMNDGGSIIITSSIVGVKGDPRPRSGQIKSDRGLVPSLEHGLVACCFSGLCCLPALRPMVPPRRMRHFPALIFDVLLGVVGLVLIG